MGQKVVDAARHRDLGDAHGVVLRAQGPQVQRDRLPPARRARVGPLQRRQRDGPLSRVGDGDRARAAEPAAVAAASPPASSRCARIATAASPATTGSTQIGDAFGDYIIDGHLPPAGTPTQPVEAGYMANAWIRMKHEDYDDLRRHARHRRPDGEGARARWSATSSSSARSTTTPIVAARASRASAITGPVALVTRRLAGARGRRRGAGRRRSACRRSNLALHARGDEVLRERHGARGRVQGAPGNAHATCRTSTACGSTTPRTPRARSRCATSSQELLAEEAKRLASSSFRHIDRDHLERCRAVHAAFDAQWQAARAVAMSRAPRRAARADRADRRARDRGRPRRVAAQPARAVRRARARRRPADRRVVGRRDGAHRSRRAVPRLPAARHGDRRRCSTPASALRAGDLVVLPEPRARGCGSTTRDRHPAVRASAMAPAHVHRAGSRRADLSSRAARSSARRTRGGSTLERRAGDAEPVLEVGAGGDQLVTRARRAREAEPDARARRSTRSSRGTRSRSSRASAITFVWRGDADAVHLKHWVYGLPSSQPLARLDGTDVWHLTLELPPGSRVEYKLEVVRSGQRRVDRGSAQPEPRARSVRRELGRARRRLRGAGLDPARSRGAAGRHSTRSSIDSKAFGRRGFGALPPGALPAQTRRYPLLVVHDGHDYVRYASLKTILDNLIDRLEIPDVDRRADELAGPAPRVRRRRAPREVPHRGARAARSSGLLPIERPAAGPLPDGRELRRGRGALDRVALPGLLRPAAAAVAARSRSPTSAIATTAARCSIRSCSS